MMSKKLSALLALSLAVIPATQAGVSEYLPAREKSMSIDEAKKSQNKRVLDARTAVELQHVISQITKTDTDNKVADKAALASQLINLATLTAQANDLRATAIAAQKTADAAAKVERDATKDTDAAAAQAKAKEDVAAVSLDEAKDALKLLHGTHPTIANKDDGEVNGLADAAAARTELSRVRKAIADAAQKEADDAVVTTRDAEKEAAATKADAAATEAEDKAAAAQAEINSKFHAIKPGLPADNKEFAEQMTAQRNWKDKARYGLSLTLAEEGKARFIIPTLVWGALAASPAIKAAIVWYKNADEATKQTLWEAIKEQYNLDETEGKVSVGISGFFVILALAAIGLNVTHSGEDVLRKTELPAA